MSACIPAMTAWVECCYGSQPILQLGKQSISSCCGVQQGDPLGPPCFTLALHPFVGRISEQVLHLQMMTWHLDDRILCGSATELLTALHIIEVDGPDQGLHLNRSISLLFIPPDAIDPIDNPLLSDIPIARDNFSTGFPCWFSFFVQHLLCSG